MRPTADGIAHVRRWMLLLTGLSCLAYALMALWQGRPDPILWFVPGAVGVLAAVAISASALLAGRAQAKVAHDELHRLLDHRAQRHAYWFALALYPVFGMLLAQGIVTHPVAFAAMGTLTGAFYLLLFVFYEVWTR